MVLEDEEGLYNAIYSIEDLKHIQNANRATIDRYKLMNDLNFEGVTDWKPFVMSAKLDGDGFTIKNLTLSSTGKYQGLFSQISGSGSVKDLTIENFDIKGTTYVGSLAGYSTGNSTIDNVLVKNSTVQGIEGVGGLLGRADNTTLQTTSVIGGTVTGTNNIGGLIGYSYQSTTDNKIENVYTNTNVQGIGLNIGGIIGYADSYSNSYPLVLTNAFTTSKVEGQSYVGGIIGYQANYHKFTNVYALNASVQGTTDVGDLVGIATVNGAYDNVAIHNGIQGNGSHRYATKLVTQTDVENGLEGISEELFKLYSEPEYNDIYKVFEDEEGLYNAVYTIDDLKEIQNANRETVDRYKLMNDLDFEGVTDWKPFVMSSKLDGNGFTIKNLTLSSTGNNQGLFSKITTGSVKNLTIENFDIKGATYVGALAGYSEGNAKINNVNVKHSTVQGTEGVGGLFGRADNTTLQTISIDGGSVKGKNSIGGLVGYVYSQGVNSKYTDVYTNTNVQGTGNDVGGIVGRGLSYSYSNPLELTNALSTSKVEGINQVGGIVGYQDTNYVFTNVFALNEAVQGTGVNVGYLMGYAVSGTQNTVAINDSIQGNASHRYATTLITPNDALESLDEANSSVTDLYVQPNHSEQPTVLEDEEGLYNPIYTIEELKGIQNANNAKIDRYKLMNNLDFEGVTDWTPFIMSTEFDGNGFTIKNLTISSTASAQGLFSAITASGTVKDLTIENFNIKGASNVGILAGTVNNANIKNVKVSGKVFGTGSYIGGLTGQISNSTVIEDTYVHANVVGNDSNVGGLIGYSNESKIKDSYSAGNVTAKGIYTGGLVGQLRYSELNHAYSSSIVDGTHVVGGLVGLSTGGKIENSLALNPYIEGENILTAAIGRTVGTLEAGTVINNVYAHDTMVSNLTHENYYTKLITDEEARQSATFESLSFDMNDKWGITEDESFAFIKAFGEDAWDDGSRYAAPFDPILSLEKVTTTSTVLKWSKVNSADTYIIKRNGEVVGTTADTTFTDKGLTRSTDYQYEVIAQNEFGESEAATLKVRTLDMPTVSDYKAKEVNFNDVTLGWHVSADELIEEFIITRDGEEIGRMPYEQDLESYTFKDSGLSNGTTHKYEITIKYNGELGTATPLNVTTKAVGVPKVELIKAKDSSLEFKWEPIEHATEYLILRNGEQIAKVTVTQYLDSGLKYSTAFEYEVIAVSPYGNSKADKVQLQTTDLMHDITLNWFGLDNVVSYNVYRDGTLLGNTTETSFVDHEAIVGKNHRYGVEPVYADGTVGKVTNIDIKPQKDTSVAEDEEFGFALGTIDGIPATGLYYEDTIQWPGYSEGIDSKAAYYEVYNDGNKIATIQIGKDKQSYYTYEYKDFDGNPNYKIVVLDKDKKEIGHFTPKTAKGKEELLPEIKIGSEDPTSMFDWSRIIGASKYEIYRDGVLVHEQVDNGSSYYRYVDHTAEPDTLYHYKLVAYKADGTSAETDIGFHQLGGDIKVIDRAKVNVVQNGDEAQVSWENFEDIYETTITKYRVLLEIETSPGIYTRVGTAQSVTGDSHTLKGLKPDTNYRVTVTPVINGKYNEEASTTKEFKTAEKEVEATITVMNITAENLGDGKALVKWDNFSSNGVNSTRYRVQRYVILEDGTFEKDGFAKTTTTNKLDVTGLVKGKTYYFDIVPQVGGMYKTEHTGISNSITLEEEKPAEVVVNEKIKDIVATQEENSIVVNWPEYSFDNKAVTKFRVQAYEIDPVTKEMVAKGAAVSTSSPSYTLSKVVEGKSYIMKVTPLVNGVYNEEYAAYSNEVNVPIVEVEEEAPNYELRVNAADDSKVILDWDVVPDATRYRIDRYKLNTETNQYEREGYGIATANNTYTFTNLTKDTTYRFVVVPRIGYVFNEKIIIENFYIPEVKPVDDSAEGNMKTTQISGVHVIMENTKGILHWEPVIIDGTTIERYKIQRYVLDDKTNQYVADSAPISVNGTEFADKYYQDDINETYQYHITPLMVNKYLTEWKTVLYNVHGVNENEVKVFADTVGDNDTTEQQYSVQRLIFDSDLQKYVTDGEPFTANSKEFVDTEKLAAGSKYKYQIKLITE